jgi:hypothetical protein
MFVGLLAGGLLLLGGVLAYEKRSPDIARVAALVLAGLVLFTLNIGGYSLYDLAVRLPGISAVRAVTRVVLLMMLPVSIIVALAVHRVVERAGDRWGQKMGALLGMLCVTALSFEMCTVRHVTTSVADWQGREHAVRAALPKMDGDAVLLVVWGDDGHQLLYELDGMIVAQDYGIPTLNGYSGNAPSSAWLQAAWEGASPSAERRVEVISPMLLQSVGAGSQGELLKRVISVSPDKDRERLVLDPSGAASKR